MEPARPKLISPFATSCLESLGASGVGRFISIGGAFGLAHYIEYRPTHDIDAWWREPVGRDIRDQVIGAIRKALEAFGEVRTRSWGDVTSVELVQKGETTFSFQIAGRSAQLAEPVSGQWPGGICVDGLDDLIASKMRALVERGAPRDFRDIMTVCSAGLCDARGCWGLWRARQGLAHENVDGHRARTAVLTHLSRIAVARPLDLIADPAQREQASRLRAWFEKEFLDELPD